MQLSLNNRSTKYGLTAIGLAVIVGAGIWWTGQQKPKEEQVSPEITLEPAKQIIPKLIPPMSETEKKAIDEIFTNEGAEVTMLKDVSGGQAVGTAWRHQGKKFVLKMEVSRLASLDKGFFYEGWLVGDAGFFSIGRLGEEGGSGKIYYQTDEDKGLYRGLVITKEPEDGEAAPAQHVLEGSF